MDVLKVICWAILIEFCIEFGRDLFFLSKMILNKRDKK